MGSGDEVLVRDMVERFPVLGADLVEHLEDNFGELLPHVFLADLMRRVVELHDAGLDPRQDEGAKRIIDYLEDRFRSGDDQVQELISTGFVEVLPREGEPGYGVRSLLGPELSAEAKRVA